MGDKVKIGGGQHGSRGSWGFDTQDPSAVEESPGSLPNHEVSFSTIKFFSCSLYMTLLYDRIFSFFKIKFIGGNTG